MAWTSNQAEPQPTPQIGGIMASKLFVGNLPRNVTDSDLADFVSNAGFQVTAAQVIRDKMTGDPKGFGFVELAEGADLQQAIGSLNGQMLQDRRLNVSEARPQRPSLSRRGPAHGGRGAFGRRRDYSGTKVRRCALARFIARQCVFARQTGAQAQLPFHHAFPTSVRHGLKLWEIDPAYGFIRLLKAVGLACDVQTVPADKTALRSALSSKNCRLELSGRHLERR